MFSSKYLFKVWLAQSLLEIHIFHTIVDTKHILLSVLTYLILLTFSIWICVWYDGIWNEAGQRLIEFCQENALVITNTLFQQHKRRLYTQTSPNGQHQNQIDYSLQPKMEKLYTVSKNKTRSWLWLRSWTPYCQIQTEIEESRENH